MAIRRGLSIGDSMRLVSAQDRGIWLALLLLGVGLCPVALPSSTALSAGNDTFFRSFTDRSITEIHVTLTNYQLSKEMWSAYSPDNPYVLDRNLLIHSTLDPYGQLDFAFLMGKVRIASNVTITFKQLVLRNIKKLGGLGVDFFMGAPNSTIVLQDVVRVKMVCNPIKDAVSSAATFKSFPPWPPNNVSVQGSTCILDANRQPACYHNSLYFGDFTLAVTASDPEAGAYGGYVLHMHNTTRVCDNYITEQCMQQLGIDTCTAQLLDQVINGTKSPSDFWTPGAIAGIAVAGAVVLGSIAVCVFFRGKLLALLVHLGGESLKELDSTSSGRTGMDTQVLLPGGTGGTITTSRSTPRDTVRLGVLLGSGSFGRVYRGRWHSTDVAVKIISCSPNELPRVLKEAEVMMQLNHVNIVRAFQCSVFRPLQHNKGLQIQQSVPSAVLQHPPSSRLHLSDSTSHPSSIMRQHSSSTQSGTRPPVAPDTLVVNIMPDIVQQRQSLSAAGSGAKSTSSSSKRSSGAGGHRRRRSKARSGTAGSSSTSSSETIRQMFSKVLHHGQQHQPQQQQRQSWQGSTALGPATTGTSQEGHRPLMSFESSAAIGSGSLINSVPLAGGINEPGSSGAAAAGAVPHYTAPLTFIPTTTAGTLWQHSPAAAAEGSAAASRSPNLGLPSGGTADVSSGVSVGKSASRLYSSGPHALGEGRDAVAWSSMFTAHRPRASSTSSRSATSGGIDPAGTSGTGPQQQQQQQQQQDGSDAAEIQLAAGWFRRPRRSSGTASSARGAGSSAGAGIVPGASVAGPNVRRPSGLQQVVISTPADEAADESDEDRRQEVQVWLVLELCTGGTLKDAVSEGKLKTSSTLELGKLLSQLLDAASGMAYLHSRGILHGDLKAGNVLLVNSIHGSYGQIAKIADFGLAAILLDGATHRTTANMGTITHMAPEVLHSGHMSPAADIFSFGIMMWECYTKQQAHAGLHYGAVVERVIVRGDRPTIPRSMPSEYAALMKSCWDEDAGKRPTFVQIMQSIEVLLDNLGSEAGSSRISEEDRSIISSHGQGAAAGPSAAAEPSVAVTTLELAKLPGASKQQLQPEGVAWPGKPPGSTLSSSVQGTSIAGPSTSATAASAATAAEQAGQEVAAAPVGTSSSLATSPSVVAQQGLQPPSLEQLQKVKIPWQAPVGVESALRPTNTTSSLSNSNEVGLASGAGLTGSGFASNSGAWSSGLVLKTPTPRLVATVRSVLPQRPVGVGASTPNRAAEGSRQDPGLVQDL